MSAQIAALTTELVRTGGAPLAASSDAERARKQAEARERAVAEATEHQAKLKADGRERGKRSVKAALWL